jgi:hypothetical protein
MRASTAVHRARITKGWEQKPDVSNGETGNQHTGLDQYRAMMQEAERIHLEGGSGKSVAQIFANLHQNKGRYVPGPDAGKKGSDRAAELQGAKRQTTQRLRTAKTFNANQRAMDVGGSEGFSIRKA